MSYNQKEVKKTQCVALEVFKYFKKFCDEHGLTYFAIGGTCIGAVRHKGFIPWDDDIDVAMPVDDYYRFLELGQSQIVYPFEIVNPKNIKHYHALYIKLQDASTTFVESFIADYPDRYSGIYLDVFPVYGLPKDRKLRNKLIRKNELLKKVNYKLRFPMREMSTLKGKISWLGIGPFRRCVPFYWATEKQQNLFKQIPFNSSNKVYFPWRAIPGSPGSGNYKNVFFYKDFCDTVEMPFEDTTISVPIGFDRYLTMDFGDYMKLPPKEKQTPGHPKAIIDLDTPYKYYAEKKEKSK